MNPFCSGMFSWFLQEHPAQAAIRTWGSTETHLNISHDEKKSLALMPGRFSFSNLRCLVGLFLLVWSGKELTSETLQSWKCSPDCLGTDLCRDCNKPIYWDGTEAFIAHFSSWSFMKTFLAHMPVSLKVLLPFHHDTSLNIMIHQSWHQSWPDESSFKQPSWG